MVGTILPIVYGERGNGTGRLCLGLYVVGCIIGGSCVGWLLGALGAAIPEAVRGGGVVVVGVACAVQALATAHDMRLFRIEVPVSRWQVPQKWAKVARIEAAVFAYGLLSGVGVLTRIRGSAFMVVLAWVIYCGSASLGAIVLGGYGLARAVPVIALAVGGYSLEEAVIVERQLAGWEPVVPTVNGVTLALATGVLIGMAAV